VKPARAVPGSASTLRIRATASSGSKVSARSTQMTGAGAFLVGASLRGADLRGAYLRLAKLDGADLSDANLEGVEGLTQGQLNRAHCNSGTKLPAGLIGVEDGKR
jgi:uncharacterized protein YjbI with pentapeptide repeats